jgi:membrane protease YdiL (CAAX protease family)
MHTNMRDQSIHSSDNQLHRCRWKEIALFWAASTLPMCVFSWYIIPILIQSGSQSPASWYWLATAMNGVLLAFLSLWILHKEQGGFNALEFQKRIRLTAPVFPKNRSVKCGALRYLLPIYFVFLLSLTITLGAISTFPMMFLTWPSYSNPFELAGIEHAGHWFWGFLVLCAWVLNAGSEELLFRGILLPRMDMVRAGWLRNAFWYSIYNLHRPWAIPFRMIDGIVFAWPNSRFRSLWVSLSIRAFEGVGLALLISIAGDIAEFLY